MITGVVSAATLTRGFIGYLDVFIALPHILTITLLLGAITFLACWGITESAYTAAVITIIEIAGLLLVIFAFGDSLFTSSEKWENLLPPVKADIWLSISLGAFIAFYAFVGFEDMVNVAEEVIEPEKTLPKAIMLAVIFSSSLYVIIAVVAVFNMTPAQLNQGDAPLASLLALKSKSLANIISVIGLIAIINGALVQLIMSSRMLYGLANQSMAPKVFSSVNHVSQTPIIATLTIASAIWLFAIALPLVSLAKITSFITLTVFLLINTSLLKINLRRREQLKSSLLKSKTILPFLGAISCLLLLIIQLSQYLIN